MAKMRQTGRRAWVLLAFLAAIALLVAPLARAQAMPCHDHANAHVAIAASPQIEATSDHNGLQGTSLAIDHQTCCANTCSFCVVVFGTASAIVLDRIAVGPHYQQGDQIVTGLAFPPILGPPRARV